MLAPTEDKLQAVLRKIITRPALANERVQTNSAGQVVLKLKNPWCDGTTYLAMSPRDFIRPHIDGQLCGIAVCECYFS